MSAPIEAYPLCWPAGWRRTHASDRKRAQFGKARQVYRTEYLNGVPREVPSYKTKQTITVADAIQRVLDELVAIGVVTRDAIVISTNMPTRLDGLPRSGSREPIDPGAAVYWSEPGRKEPRCMAVDRYDRLADNLAAIAATLEAMRAIERHGGAEILERAFTGFAALAAPEQWWQVLGLAGPDVTSEQIQTRYRSLASFHHPDRGGDGEQMARINRARDLGLEAVR